MKSKIGFLIVTLYLVISIVFIVHSLTTEVSYYGPKFINYPTFPWSLWLLTRGLINSHEILYVGAIVLNSTLLYFIGSEISKKNKAGNSITTKKQGYFILAYVLVFFIIIFLLIWKTHIGGPYYRGLLGTYYKHDFGNGGFIMSVSDFYYSRISEANLKNYQIWDNSEKLEE